MRNDDEDTLYKLVDKARPLGFFVGLHTHFDPFIGGGPFYVMKRNPGQKNQSLLRYATAERVEEFLDQQVENYAN